MGLLGLLQLERSNVPRGPEPDRKRERDVVEARRDVVVMDRKAKIIGLAFLEDFVVPGMAGAHLAGPDNRPGAVVPLTLDVCIVGGRPYGVGPAEQAPGKDVTLLPAGIGIVGNGVFLSDHREGLGGIADIGHRQRLHAEPAGVEHVLGCHGFAIDVPGKRPLAGVEEAVFKDVPWVASRVIDPAQT